MISIRQLNRPFGKRRWANWRSAGHSRKACCRASEGRDRVYLRKRRRRWSAAYEAKQTSEVDGRYGGKLRDAGVLKTIANPPPTQSPLRCDWRHGPLRNHDRTSQTRVGPLEATPPASQSSAELCQLAITASRAVGVAWGRCFSARRHHAQFRLTQCPLSGCSSLCERGWRSSEGDTERARAGRPSTVRPCSESVGEELAHGARALFWLGARHKNEWAAMAGG